MEPDEETFENVQFLTGSPLRWAVLDALCATPARPCELRDEVDATRTTIQRILAGFQDRQWITKRDRAYCATVTGYRVRDAYESLLGEVARAREFGPVATYLDPIASELPDELVTAGTLVRGTDQSPLAAYRHFEERFRSAEGNVKACSPIIASSFNEIGVELLENDVEIDFVIDEGVLEQASNAFPEALQRGFDDENIEISVDRDAIEYGLLVDDRGVCLGLYDDSNNLRAVLESDDDAVREWALETFEERRSRASPLATLLSKQPE